MCDMTNDKSYGLELTAVNAVHKHVVHILDDIIFIFYQWPYDIIFFCGSQIQMPNFKASHGTPPSLCI